MTTTCRPRRTTSLPPARSLLASLTAVLVLSACGGSEEPAADGDDGTAAGATPGASASESAAADDKLTIETALPALVAAYDESRTARVDLTIDAGGQQITAQAQLEFSETTTEMAMQMQLPGVGTLDLRVVDDLIYVQSPDTPGQFQQVDPNDPSDPAAAQFSQLIESSGLDSTFDAFEAGLREVEFVETTEIDGEEVDQYEFTVDSEAALQAQGQPVPPGIPEELVYDVYLDADDRMRQVDFEVPGASSRLEIYAWGEPVDIQAPAPEQVLPAP